MVATHCCTTSSGSGRSGTGERLSRPSGQEVDAALVVERGVGSKVRFHIRVIGCCGLDLIASIIHSARQETSFVIREIFLDCWAEEIEECGIVARRWTAFAGKVSGENLFLEGVERVGYALQVLEVCDCAGNCGVLGACGEDSAGCRSPISIRDVGGFVGFEGFANNLELENVIDVPRIRTPNLIGIIRFRNG